MHKRRPGCWCLSKVDMEVNGSGKSPGKLRLSSLQISNLICGDPRDLHSTAGVSCSNTTSLMSMSISRSLCAKAQPSILTRSRSPKFVLAFKGYARFSSSYTRHADHTTITPHTKYYQRPRWEQFGRTRRRLSTSPVRRHGHLTPPKPGEE